MSAAAEEEEEKEGIVAVSTRFCYERILGFRSTVILQVEHMSFVKCTG